MSVLSDNKRMKRRKIFPIFWKFTIAVVLIVMVFGTINLYLIDYAVYDLFRTELTRHGKITARTISTNSITPILYNDQAMLNQIVMEQKQIDSNIAYIFIIDKRGEVLAHTFEKFVPGALQKSNEPTSKHEIGITKIQDKLEPSIIIRDLAVPIMEGNLGVVRIGLLEENYSKSMNATKRVFIIMVAVFLIVGIVGAFIFSYIITTPIKIISKISGDIDLENLDVTETNVFITLYESRLAKWKKSIWTNDEIDILTQRFGEMVSRLNLAYNDLQKAQNNLFQSEKMAALGILSSGLAHEINNPIAGIKNCIRRLENAPDNLNQNINYLKMMSEAINKIDVVVGGLLNYSRKPEMIFSKVNLVEVIENVLLLCSFQFERNQISIHKKYHHAPKYILASPNHIEQVVLNLILNSIDAIEELRMEDQSFIGEISLSIGEDDESYHFDLVDNGVGIKEEYLKDIFTPFFTKKKNRQGTGLGLAVSYSIIEQHEGHFSCKINDNNRGLNVSVALPKYVNK